MKTAKYTNKSDEVIELLIGGEWESVARFRFITDETEANEFLTLVAAEFYENEGRFFYTDEIREALNSPKLFEVDGAIGIA